MDKQSFIAALSSYVNTAPGNVLDAKTALSPELAGLRYFDEPLIACADPEDPEFSKLKTPGVIGEHFILPGEWLPGAKTVISFFLPSTEAVRSGNRRDMNWPANEWLHARIEGHQFLVELCRHMKTLLEDAGYEAVVPALDPRFSMKSLITDRNSQDFFTSNWSERHAAYICGLGTFGLSRGLITARGMAGRLGSIITTLPLEPAPRPYAGIYDYCIRCGACVRNCPTAAISMERGKQHPPCSAFLDRVMEKHRPRYGCGKCQVRVPCEASIPITRR
jgi:epoxyqueuosine reductase QueG